MSDKITYSCTALAGKNKKGVLTPDADGYYTVVLGALDFHNSAGQFYSFDGSRQVFEESSTFMRRVARGALNGECGHPRPHGMTNQQFVSRILDIDEKNISHHIKEVTLQRDTVKDDKGHYVVAIIGKVKPAGPKGPALEAALQNPDQNVCFSIRSLTDDVVSATQWTKNIRTCVTFDWVNEPGISVATKYHSPALESLAIAVEVVSQAAGGMTVSMEDDSDVLTPAHVMRDFNLGVESLSAKSKPGASSRSLEW